MGILLNETGMNTEIIAHDLAANAVSFLVQRLRGL